MGGGKGGNKKLITTVIYLLRTLERLCVNPIDTSCDVSVRLFLNWG